MFNIKTTLKTNARPSTYIWADQDEVTTAALLGALLGVLGASQATMVAEAAGAVAPCVGPKTNTTRMDVRVTQDGAPYLSVSVDFHGMADDEVTALIGDLSAAIAPFKGAATKTKG